MSGTDADTIKYQAVVDLDQRNNSHTLLHELAVGTRAGRLAMLEVGCSSGYLGASLVARGHHVIGVEPDPVPAAAAARVLSGVWNGGLDDYLAAPPDARVDVLVLGDVLEHKGEPAQAERRSIAPRAHGGRGGVSQPNKTQGRVRARLLEGRFEYAPRGILDHTHLRFFSRDGVARLCADAGLAIERLFEVGVAIPDIGREYDMRLRRELITAVEVLDDDNTGHAFQYVLRARPSGRAYAALLAGNLAVPVERTAAPPRPRGSSSWKQKLQVKLVRALLRSISARRHRGR